MTLYHSQIPHHGKYINTTFLRVMVRTFSLRKIIRERGKTKVDYHFQRVNILTITLSGIQYLFYYPKITDITDVKKCLAVHLSPILLLLEIRCSSIYFQEVFKMPPHFVSQLCVLTTSLVTSKQSMPSTNMLANLLVAILEVYFAQIKEIGNKCL